MLRLHERGAIRKESPGVTPWPPMLDRCGAWSCAGVGRSRCKSCLEGWDLVGADKAPPLVTRSQMLPL